MALQSAKDISEILYDSFDVYEYDRIAREIQYGFGQHESINGAVGLAKMQHSDPPDYQDVTIALERVGATNRIMGVATISLAKWIDQRPLPDITGAGEHIGKMIQAFYAQRTKSFDDIRKRVFFDGDQLGLGVAWLYYRTNPKTDKQFVDCEYVSPLRFYWDRSKADIKQSSWCAKLINMPLYEAESRFDRKFEDDQITSVQWSATARPQKMVRIIEYISKGGFGNEPTRALFLDNWTSEDAKLSIEAWPHEFLPVSVMTGYMLPGWRSYIGRVFLQMPNQELLNQVRDRLISDTSSGAHVTVVDESQFANTEDIDLLKGGKPGLIISANGIVDPKRPILMREPAVPLDPTLMALLEKAEEDSNTLSGTNDLMRGNVTQSRTLGQDQLLTNLSSTTMAYAGRQLCEFDTQLCEVFLKMAKEGDRDPVTIDFRENTLELNGSDGRSSVEHMIPEAFNVVLDREGYTEQDEAQERANRRAELAALYQMLAPTGSLNMAWFAEEWAEACGSDPKSAISSNGTQAGAMSPAGQQMGGAPMPGQAGMGVPVQQGQPMQMPMMQGR